jgi:hypothetical protein
VREVFTLRSILKAELGKTIVLVTHDLHASSLCPKDGHLEKGALLEDSPQNVLNTGHPGGVPAATYGDDKILGLHRTTRRPGARRIVPRN